AVGAQDRLAGGRRASPAGAPTAGHDQDRHARAVGAGPRRHALASAARRSPEGDDARRPRGKKDATVMAEPVSAVRLAPVPASAAAAPLSRRRSIAVWALIVVASVISLISI